MEAKSEFSLLQVNIVEFDDSAHIEITETCSSLLLLALHFSFTLNIHAKLIEAFYLRLLLSFVIRKSSKNMGRRLSKKFCKPLGAYFLTEQKFMSRPPHCLCP